MTMDKMYVYIKLSIAATFVSFEKPLSEEEYNNIGSTWQDFLDNLWVPLSDEQVAFHEEHPGASVNEVWDMQLNPVPERTLEDAKSEMIERIEEYDRSEAVNSFTIRDIVMWLSVEERVRIATQISVNETVGRTEMTRWFNGREFTFPLTTWRQMLVALEVYAGDAINVTEAHKVAVNSLTTIEEVDSYDYTIGYPEKLIFGEQ
jgi:hypothetical protein